VIGLGSILEFRAAQPTAFALLIIAAVAASGLALGSVHVRGVGLGVAGVLFSGLVAGHLGLPLSTTRTSKARA